jgi:hypothetical protein
MASTAGGSQGIMTRENRICPRRVRGSRDLCPLKNVRAGSVAHDSKLAASYGDGGSLYDDGMNGVRRQAYGPGFEPGSLFPVVAACGYGWGITYNLSEPLGFVRRGSAYWGAVSPTQVSRSTEANDRRGPKPMRWAQTYRVSGPRRHRFLGRFAHVTAGFRE